MKLDILSDPVCPWCYIGKARLDRALEAHPGHPFVIEWHPFRLNPEMPPEGMDRRAYEEWKFGGPEAAARHREQVGQAARDAGLEINWDAIGRAPQTIDTHRLIHWAGLEGRQTPVVSAIFKAYFREGRDISDKTVLAEIAGEMGLDRDMIAHLLTGDADRDDIANRDAHARERGVTGVPTFIVGERHAVVGAQPAELWEKVIAEVTGQAADFRDG